MKRLLVVNVPGLSSALAQDDANAPNLAALRAGGASSLLEPAFPAITCTVQASIATGLPASGHGVVANGLYLADLLRVSFWEQSNRLVSGEPLWVAARRRATHLKNAMLFWQNSMGSANDVLLTPAPLHAPDGRTISSCYARPAGLYDALAEELGPFPLASYWGPMAGAASSEWIARATARVLALHAPDLALSYLPHLDYDLQRFGPDSPEAKKALATLDALLGELAEAARAAGYAVAIVGEYAMTRVAGASRPNARLREAGLLEVRRVEDEMHLDIVGSRAFCMCDHQVAHVYVREKRDRAEAAEALRSLDGVDEVLDAEGQAPLGVNHPRSGALVAVSAPDRWLSYKWWTDEAEAPAYARTVDIHAKPGYDPAELFVDPEKKCIASDESLVKGSHGRAPASDAERPVLILSEPFELPKGPIRQTELKRLFLEMLAPPRRGGRRR